MCDHFSDGCDTASMQLPTGTAEEVLKIIGNLRVLLFCITLSHSTNGCRTFALAVHPACGQENTDAQKQILFRIEKTFIESAASSELKVELTSYSTDDDPKVAKMKYVNLALSFLERQSRPD